MTNNHYPDHCDNRGGEPLVANIRKDAIKNKHFRNVYWTGDHLQAVLMSIPVCGDIGVEIHGDTDQILYIEEGRAKCMFGNNEHMLCKEQCADSGDMIFVPCGTWHNIVNVGNTPLKLFTVYAPPHHPKNTVE